MLSIVSLLSNTIVLIVLYTGMTILIVISKGCLKLVSSTALKLSLTLSDLSVLQAISDVTFRSCKCVVPENIHTPPMEGFSNNLNPPPLQKFPFCVILSLKKFGF